MKGDFIGFSFDGIHSDDLNILRVASSDRYKEELVPPINDVTTNLSFRDGELYYGTNYKSRKFDVDIAFDSVTEEQYRNMRRLYGQKAICPLIFDERPYKVYMAKISSPMSLETICFDEPIKESVGDFSGIFDKVIDDEGNLIPVEERERREILRYNSSKTQRIYKGEGSIEFTCYSPFARQQFKTLDEYREKYTNVDEWAESSGILTANEYAIYDRYITDVSYRYGDNFNGQINVYNPGDLPAPYYLFIPFTDGKIESPTRYVEICSDGAECLYIEPFSKETNSKAEKENGVIINTQARLIEGVRFDHTSKSWERSGNIYNKYIAGGKFGRILNGDKFSYRIQGIYLNYTADESNPPQIFYNYLYY